MNQAAKAAILLFGLDAALGHVSLQFPPARSPLDFLDNIRTADAYCGAPACLNGVMQPTPTYYLVQSHPESTAEEPEGETTAEEPEEPEGETEEPEEPEGETTAEEPEEPEGETEEPEEPEGETAAEEPEEPESTEESTEEEPENETEAEEPEGETWAEEPEGETEAEGEEPEGETEAEEPEGEEPESTGEGEPEGEEPENTDGNTGADVCFESPVTHIDPARPLTVHWDMGRPHGNRPAAGLPGGNPIDKDMFQIFFIERGNVTEIAALAGDTTAQHAFDISVPADAACWNVGDCQIALRANSYEYGGTYFFKSCSEIVYDNSLTTDCVADCTGHGTCNNGVCECDDTHHGDYCEEEVDCTMDSQCNGGTCFNGVCSTPNAAGNIPDDSYFTDPADLAHGSFMGDGYEGFYKQLDASTMEFKLRAETDSWVGIGWKPASAGGHPMDNTDMVLGAVLDDGSVLVDDFWAFSRSTPQRDIDLGGESNILDFAGVEENGVTTIWFTRSLTTGGDEWDHDITDSDLRIIYAFGQMKDGTGVYRFPDIPDPHSKDFYARDLVKYHGGDRFISGAPGASNRGRGQLTLNLLQTGNCANLGYDKVTTLSPSYCLHTTVVDNTAQIALQVETDGFVALGVRPEGVTGMVGTRAIVASVNAGGDVNAGVYDLNGKGAGEQVLNAAGIPAIINLSGTEENGWTTVEFEIADISTWPGVSLVDNAFTNIAWAYLDGSDDISYHGGTKSTDSIVLVGTGPTPEPETETAEPEATEPEGEATDAPNQTDAPQTTDAPAPQQTTAAPPAPTNSLVSSASSLSSSVALVVAGAIAAAFAC